MPDRLTYIAANYLLRGGHLMPPQRPKGNAAGQITLSIQRETYGRLNAARARLSVRLGATVTFSETLDALLDFAEAEDELAAQRRASLEET